MRLFQAKKRVRPRDFSRTYALAVETGIGENHVRRTAAPIFDGAGKGKVRPGMLKLTQLAGGYARLDTSEGR